MLSGKRTAVFALALTASCAVIGCISFPSAKRPPAGLLDPTPVKRVDPAPDNAVAQQDIPVVPLPPFPRGNPDPVRPPVQAQPQPGPIIPVQATSQAPPPIPLPPAPPPPPVTAQPPVPLPPVKVPPPVAVAPVTPTPAPPPAPVPSDPALEPPPSLEKPPEIAPIADKGGEAKRLTQQAADTYAGMDSYIARLTRREVVGGKPKPEETMLFKFRKQPWSVYFKWLGDEGKGREVVYVKGQYENKLHTLLAKGDMPALFMPANGQMALGVDDLLVRSASRHSITDAGLGSSVEHLTKILAALDKDDMKHGTIVYLGLQQRPEYPKPLPMIEHTIPAGMEPELPRGGKRTYGFDPQNHLPVLVVTRDDKGQEVEYYRYDRIEFPVRLDDDDFNPDKLWKAAPKPTAPPAK